MVVMILDPQGVVTVNTKLLTITLEMRCSNRGCGCCFPRLMARNRVDTRCTFNRVHVSAHTNMLQHTATTETVLTAYRHLLHIS